MKFLKIFLLAIIALIATVNVASAQTTETTQQPEVTTIKLSVKGITCATDLTMIADNVQKLEGISSCEVLKQGATSKFAVTFNPAVVTEHEIQTAIESTGSCENPDERPYKVKQ